MRSAHGLPLSITLVDPIKEQLLLVRAVSTNLLCLFFLFCAYRCGNKKAGIFLLSKTPNAERKTHVRIRQRE